MQYFHVADHLGVGVIVIVSLSVIVIIGALGIILNVVHASG